MIELTTTETSSIGAAWPPCPSNNDRLRGFYDGGVIPADQTAVYEFTDELEAIRSTMVAESTASRLAVKAVMEDDALQLVRSFVRIEAAIPLGNGHEGLSIAYLGFNNTSRLVTDPEMATHRAQINNAVHGLQANRQHTTHTADNLAVHVHDGATADSTDIAALTPEFSQLFSVFGYSPAETETILGDSSNLIVYMRNPDDGRIVSSAMAETGTIAVQGLGDVTITEITEAITPEEFRGRGYYRLVSGLLVRELCDRVANGQAIHAIFGEGNLAAAGVLRAAAQNGRRFSLQDARRYGITSSSFGVLPNSFAINDGNEPGYRSLAVSYVPGIVR